MNMIPVHIKMGDRVSIPGGNTLAQIFLNWLTLQRGYLGAAPPLTPSDAMLDLPASGSGWMAFLSASGSDLVTANSGVHSMMGPRHAS